MVKKETDTEDIIENRVKIIKPYYDYNINILSKNINKKSKNMIY